MPLYHPKAWGRAGDIVVFEDRTFDFTASRMEVDWTFIRGSEEEHKHTSARLYSRTR
jgi:hypothetical protein